MLKFYTSAIISLPLLISFTFMYFSYELSGEEKIAFPLGISLLTIIFLEFKVKFRKAIQLQFLKDSKTVYLLSYSIIAWGLLDLFDHGLVILNPHTYSTFLPHQAWIRHFSSLSWTLAPVALLLPLRRIQKISFFAWAFLFPILVVDRNRLLLAFFATIVSLIFSSLHLGREKKIKIALVAILTIFMAISSFIYVGHRRIGATAISEQYRMPSAPIPLTKPCSLPDSLPVKKTFREISPSSQWLFLYTTSPIYNLSVQVKCEVSDSSLLKAQLIPLWKKFNAVGAPYLVAMGQNVGTELMPFYMAFGVIGIFVAILGAYAILKFSLIHFLNNTNIFNFLIFLRLSYCAFMMGFAPQFFTWTTFGFVVLIKTIERVSGLIGFKAVQTS